MDWKVIGKTEDEIFECEVIDDDSEDIVHTLNDFMVFKENIQEWRWEVEDDEGRGWFTVYWFAGRCTYAVNHDMRGIDMDAFDAMTDAVELLCDCWTRDHEQGGAAA